MQVVETSMGETTQDPARASLRKSLTFSRKEVCEVLRAMCFSPEPGISLDKQVEAYGKFLGQWSEPRGHEGFESRKRAILSSLDIGPKLLEKVVESQNLAELQKAIVILNCNEFLLRKNPTRDEFSMLVNDVRDHFTRIGAKCFPELTQKLNNMAKEIETAALAQYDKLNKVEVN